MDRQRFLRFGAAALNALMPWRGRAGVISVPGFCQSLARSFPHPGFANSYPGYFLTQVLRIAAGVLPILSQDSFLSRVLPFLTRVGHPYPGEDSPCPGEAFPTRARILT